MTAPLFVQIDAAVCNANSTQINTTPVTLVSQLTGDAGSFFTVETGVNTGLFRIFAQRADGQCSISSRGLG